MLDKEKNQFTNNAVSGMKTDFVVVGRHRIHSWYAWAIIGIVFGMALGIIYVAGRTAQFARSEAASCASNPFQQGCSYPKQRNNYSVLSFVSDGNEVISIGSDPGNAFAGKTLTARKIATPGGWRSFGRYISVTDQAANAKAKMPNGTQATFTKTFTIDPLPFGAGSYIEEAHVRFVSNDDVLVRINGFEFPLSEERVGGGQKVRTIRVSASQLIAGQNTMSFTVTRNAKLAQSPFAIAYELNVTIAPRSLGAGNSELSVTLQPGSIQGNNLKPGTTKRLLGISCSIPQEVRPFSAAPLKFEIQANQLRLDFTRSETAAQSPRLNNLTMHIAISAQLQPLASYQEPRLAPVPGVVTYSADGLSGSVTFDVSRFGLSATRPTLSDPEQFSSCPTQYHLFADVVAGSNKNAKSTYTFTIADFTYDVLTAAVTSTVPLVISSTEVIEPITLLNK